jgi:hypothetical protein
MGDDEDGNAVAFWAASRAIVLQWIKSRRKELAFLLRPDPKDPHG